MKQKTIFWFRRDLRLHDNHGLYKALKDEGNVIPIFIFDKNILDELPPDDARVSFIHDQVTKLKNQLKAVKTDLLVSYGQPIDVWKRLVHDEDIKAVYTNRDYEPYAKDRDDSVAHLLQENGIALHTFKDHVIFEKEEVTTNTGGIYTVFTPYKRKWLQKFEEQYLDIHQQKSSFFPSEKWLHRMSKRVSEELITLEEMGFHKSSLAIPEIEVTQKVIKNYADNRDYPAKENGTTKLGIHFRFGTISIREKAVTAHRLSATFLSELIWRDFYSQILDNFPYVVDQAFRPRYDAIPWRTSEDDFQNWCEGLTGYPLVDAGMRQLNQTGYMHNRVRMITASFLTKHLLIDWRKGEAYFAQKLLDYDLASNNGGWQWAAGSGTDAAPYFRIFNPSSQQKKFDKNYEYIRKWVPEFDSDKYPDPIVEHKFARERCLDVYKTALNNN